MDERIFRHTDRTRSVFEPGKWSDERQFVSSREENNANHRSDEPVHDMWMCEPLFSQKHDGVHTVHGDERSKPKWDACDSSQRLAQHFAYYILDDGMGWMVWEGNDQMNETGTEKAESDLIDATESE
jgi:hypothetical protein